MSNNDSVTSHTRKRRSGQRLSKEERARTQQIFLQAFSITANVRAACLKAGISRNTIYEWAEHDTEFSILYKQAELDANDMIRAELFRRGVQGYEKPVASMGKQVFVTEIVNGQKVEKPLMERVYSDSLLSLLAKARMPEFREKQQQLDVMAQQNTQDAILTQYMTDEEISILESIMERARVRKAEAEEKITPIRREA